MTLSALKASLCQIAYWPHRDVGIGELRFKHLDDSRPDDSLCSISPGCRIDLTGNVVLGKFVMIASGVHIMTHEHTHVGRLVPRLEQDAAGSSIVVTDKEIGGDVWIYPCIILPKCVKIARGVSFGAGSVVT